MYLIQKVIYVYIYIYIHQHKFQIFITTNQYFTPLADLQTCRLLLNIMRDNACLV